MAFTSDEAFTLLQRARENNRLAHAYLITGPEGSGTREVATQLCGLIMQEAEEPLKHPDVHVAEPESKSRRIVIEQVRNLEKSLQMRSLRGGKKVGIIFDADRLMEQAANAFLKTLEEPPNHSHLILVSSVPDQLLETILSRCIEISLKPITRREPTERQQELLRLLQNFSKTARPDFAQALTFVREFQALLAQTKAATTAEGDAAFKQERQYYRETTGAGSDWVDDREDYYKARSEARYRLERSALVETLEQWWGDILRHQHGATHLDHPGFGRDTAALAERLSVTDVLHRAAALGTLRENFGRNVQEQLAIEVAFLEAFAA